MAPVREEGSGRREGVCGEVDELVGKTGAEAGMATAAAVVRGDVSASETGAAEAGVGSCEESLVISAAPSTVNDS